jgi:uncharacterized protein (UPF0276 family)
VRRRDLRRKEVNVKGSRSQDTHVGLGLRRELMAPLKAETPSQIQFLEVAPENWIGVGGRLKKDFRELTEHYPLFCHGLSLSLGGPVPLDERFLKQVKKFLNEYSVEVYSEHLSFSGDAGQLYDLLPIPFTKEAVHYVSRRIRRAQDILERPIAIENVSYYVKSPLEEMDELHFLNSVLEEANCRLLLDVNNVFVNSVNHDYDPLQFLRGIDGERIAYLHIAGHYRKSKDLIIDTHGAPVVDPVWGLLEKSYRLFGIKPTLLERDFNLPPLDELLDEVDRIRRVQEASEEVHHAKRA